jgi:hypothetical protein
MWGAGGSYAFICTENVVLVCARELLFDRQRIRRRAFFNYTVEISVQKMGGCWSNGSTE